jgi:lambda family phage portal protein
MAKIGMLDRAIASVAPQWGLRRLQSRMALAIAARHYEAAAPGRRTVNWARTKTDANAASRGQLGTLRDLSRDLVRNNAWARRGLRVIHNHTVGWGILPKADETGGGDVTKIAKIWKQWAGTTACDTEGKRTFYGMQRQIVRTMAESGEVLIRRRYRQARDGLPVPFQIQILEPDYIDSNRNNVMGQQGGPIVQGVEFDAIGRVVAYWLFSDHPGSSLLRSPVSRRIDAVDVLHIFECERPGQVRGVSWFSPVIVRLKDFDEFEDATLMRQKIAACFTAFVTDPNGEDDSLGEEGTDVASDQPTDTLEPGLIVNLPVGRDVKFASPPSLVESAFSINALRYAAAGLGVTYEDLTGDYSQVNFSSARMARTEHWHNVEDWRENTLLPQACDPVWLWFLEALDLFQLARVGDPLPAKWTPPPQPMIDPEKEGLAAMRRVRAGMQTFSELVREQGRDPDEHWAEYKKDLDLLDKLGIKLDSDVRAVSQAGLTQERPGGAPAGGGGGGGGGGSKPKNGVTAKTDVPASA